jgi:hypothetical protein
MAAQKPLVIINGQVQQIPPGDTLAAASSEVDVISMSNAHTASLTIGQPVFVSSAGAVNLASASASGTSRVLGLVKDASIAASASGFIQTDGILSATTADWDAVTGATGGLTAGAVYYLSTTAGQLATAAPTGAGQFVMKVGMGISATEIEIDTDRGGVLLA